TNAPAALQLREPHECAPEHVSRSVAPHARSTADPQQNSVHALHVRAMRETARSRTRCNQRSHTTHRPRAGSMSWYRRHHRSLDDMNASDSLPSCCGPHAFIIDSYAGATQQTRELSAIRVGKGGQVRDAVAYEPRAQPRQFLLGRVVTDSEPRGALTQRNAMRAPYQQLSLVR